VTRFLALLLVSCAGTGAKPPVARDPADSTKDPGRAPIIVSAREPSREYNWKNPLVNECPKGPAPDLDSLANGASLDRE